MTTEQRDSYRCPTIEPGQKAVLRFGKREVIVALSNQSAGGFSVIAEGSLPVQEGQSLDVRTSAGWFQARVIHKQELENQTKLGLLRVADLPDPRDAALVKAGGCKFARVGGGQSKSGSLLLVVIVAGLAFWGFLVNFAWFRGPDVAGQPVKLGAYLSRVMDQFTSPAQKAWSSDSQAPNSNSNISKSNIE